MGRPHVFLRLAGCPLRCSYCDTRRSWESLPRAELHLPGATEELANPVSQSELAQTISRLTEAHGVSSGRTVLSVTGGEPLAQAEFLMKWLPTWPGKVLLETAGIFADRLPEILPHLDYLSLDWKDPSDLAVGAKSLDPVACLKSATEYDRSQVASASGNGLIMWVKFILHQQTDSAWLGDALKQIAAIKSGIAVFLQPVTACSGGPQPPESSTLLAELIRWNDLPLDLRVLPQIHPLLGVR